MTNHPPVENIAKLKSASPISWVSLGYYLKDTTSRIAPQGYYLNTEKPLGWNGKATQAIAITQRGLFGEIRYTWTVSWTETPCTGITLWEIVKSFDRLHQTGGATFLRVEMPAV